MLAETSSTRQGGQAWEWYDRARLSLAKFPTVRALVLFHDANDRTLGTHSVDFGADDDVTRPAWWLRCSGHFEVQSRSPTRSKPE